MSTIRKVVEDHLCISCGTCIANCPKNCVAFQRSGNMFLPSIDMEACINCGICYKVCPSNDMACTEIDDVSKYLLGEYKEIFAASSKSESLRMSSTSGGVVTQLVKKLLEDGVYDAAYLSSGYNYDTLLESKRFEKGDDLSSTPKSRYLTISHRQMIQRMIDRPDEKLILIATGCDIQGVINTIRLKKLHRENYLLIGLFCDKTMNYGVVDYFKEHPAGNGKELQDLYFRTKEAGGWPGNVRLVYCDGTHIDLPNTERMQVKDYFMPERCLYCMDKLNLSCDIAVGDNYIPENKDTKGVNSIIIRTEIGAKVWEHCKTDFYYHEDTPEQLISSQHLNLKEKNYYFQNMKGLREGVCDRRIRKLYSDALAKMKIGNSNSYAAVSNDCKKRRIKKKIRNIFTKILGAIFRVYQKN